VTSGALPLRVTGRAQIALRVGLHPVLAKKISIVNQVAFRGYAFGGQLHVTAIAIAHVPLPGVLVAAEASCHVGAQRRVFVAHVDVAAHAIAGPALGVRGVRKPQVRSGHLRRVAGSGAAVAIRAGVRVVRILMTGHAILRRRKVKRAGFAGLLNAGVAFVAIDAFEHVGPMLKRTLWIVVLALQPENFCAGTRPPCQDHQRDDCDQPVCHFCGHCPW